MHRNREAPGLVLHGIIYPGTSEIVNPLMRGDLLQVQIDVARYLP